MRRTRWLVVVAILGAALSVTAMKTRAATYNSMSTLTTDATLLVEPNVEVYDTQNFPDGAHIAQCFIRVATTGAQLTSSYYGNCTPFALNVGCASSSFNTTTSTDQFGAANVIEVTGTPDTSHHLSGAYDKGLSGCGSNVVNGTTYNWSLAFDLSGYTTANKLVFFWNNDGTYQDRNGWVSYADNGNFATPQGIDHPGTSNNGTYYEVNPESTSGLGYMGAPSGCTGLNECSGNLTFGGVFIEPATLTAAAYSALHIQKSHGLSVITWTSRQHVLGFNVFDRAQRLNPTLVIGHNSRYRFTTRHTIHKLRLVPVWNNGSSG